MDLAIPPRPGHRSAVLRGCRGWRTGLWFQQTGPTLTGRFDVTGPVLNHVANVIGAVSGNDIVLTLPATGRLTVTGNQMTGYINGLSPARVTLRKQ